VVSDWRWWRDGVVYQCYPRSFADADGDGIGDLQGIRARLDHLEWLGVDALWLNPTFPSPNKDWGFDVSDFRGVHPDLGTEADLQALLDDCGARGIRVLLDLVPNHTSDQHPWFREALEGGPKRAFYVFREGRDGGPPNNWLSQFGGPAWTQAPDGTWYLHNFTPAQPDLDWWNDDVRAEFDDILRFWLDRGLAGYRIDVAHGIVKDRELRDQRPADESDPPIVRRYGQKPEFCMNRPEVHDVHKHWRRLLDGYGDERCLLGETWVLDLERLAEFYGSGDDELHLAFNFVFLFAEPRAEVLRGIVEDVERLLPDGAWPTWTLSNHDVERLATRWAQGDERRVRLALLLLLTLRGTPVLYYGDELGLPEADVPEDRILDRLADHPSRDGARTPMLWTGEDGHGFTAPGVEPWLPFGEGRSVAEQREDAGSVLHLVRDLLALRRATPDLHGGAYATLPAPAGAWAFRRGDATTVVLNMGDTPATVEGVEGSVAVATDRGRDGERVAGSIDLGPWQAAVITG
jgi:alpha-glucosidase